MEVCDTCQIVRDFDDTLSDLITGENSLARKLGSSHKYSLIFQRLQGKAKAADGTGFCKVIKNLSFADQRFDSRSRPLLRLFELLPVAIETLAALTGEEGDVQDRAWAQARALLKR